MREFPDIICRNCNTLVNVEEYEAFCRWQRKLLMVCKATCPSCQKWAGFNIDNVDGEAFGEDEWQNTSRLVIALFNVSNKNFAPVGCNWR